jgi:hypothetical protein
MPLPHVCNNLAKLIDVDDVLCAINRPSVLPRPDRLSLASRASGRTWATPGIVNPAIIMRKTNSVRFIDLILLV